LRLSWFEVYGVSKSCRNAAHSELGKPQDYRSTMRRNLFFEQAEVNF
jgi:hypothetical protein